MGVFERNLTLLLLVVLLLFVGCSEGRRMRNGTKPRRRDLRQEVDQLKLEMSQIRRGIDKLKSNMCPVGYLRYRTSCMRFFFAKKDWTDWHGAEGRCQSEGGHLVTVDRKPKERYIKKYLKKNWNGGSLLVYTGLILSDTRALFPYDPLDSARERSEIASGLYWTATGKPRQVGNRWAPLVPSDHRLPGGKTASCVVMEFNSHTLNSRAFWWRHEVCTGQKYSFICEIRLP